MTNHTNYLRLFKVLEGDKPHYFFHKGMAKKFRDELEAIGKPAVVMRGPDHRRGESFNVSKQTPSSKRRDW